MQRDSDLVIRERATEAVGLVENPIFQDAILKVRQQTYAELLAAPIGSLTATALHAKLVALEDIPSQLKLFINDAKMRR